PLRSRSRGILARYRQHRGVSTAQDVVVRAAILLDVADIAPVSLGYVTEECRALTQHLGIEVLGEIEVRLLGDPPQRGRLEDVDAGVDRVTEDLAPCRLLEEALDPAGLLVNDDDAERERV